MRHVAYEHHWDGYDTYARLLFGRLEDASESGSDNAWYHCSLWDTNFADWYPCITVEAAR